MRIMSRGVAYSALIAGLTAALAACGGGSSGSGSMQTSQSGSVPLLISDASSEDWATIGVKILSIALTPQGGGSDVTVYTAPSTPPMVNLAQLDQISEILGNVSVPVGTYTGAKLTIGANPGDVALTVAADPEAGFAATAGSTIPSDQIQIQGRQGASGNHTVPVKVTFDSPLVVTTSQNNALDLEFDLAHPAFIVGHTPPGSGTTLWAVSFNGPVRHHTIADITQLVLRHMYGNVTGVASDGSSITITKDLPAIPIVNPETPVAISQSLQIRADASNGTLFYDVDAKTLTTIKDFSTEAASLDGKYVRIAARYQEDGTLVAVRIWASSQFDSVWLSPEGHVLHVNSGSSLMRVADESGVAVPIAVDSNTEFFFRTPQNALADATPIGTGPSFLASGDLVRGFKVHVSVVDPLATPLVAQTVDIETAAYSGSISNADTTQLAYTRHFRTLTDDYTIALPYISSATPNGKDANGNAITGFKYWDFAYPTQVTSGANAVSDFVSAVSGSAAGGGFMFAGADLHAWGASFARWGDAANPTGWSVPWTVLAPTPLPLGIVATGVANDAFTLTLLGGSTPGTVDIGTTAGSATLVYQVDRSNGVVTVSPVDITTASGLTTLTDALTAGSAVKVYGVPQADGTFKAYVLSYFTGMQPSD